MTSLPPCTAPWWSGVIPNLLVTFTSPPRPTSARTTPAWPNLAARCSSLLSAESALMLGCSSPPWCPSIASTRSAWPRRSETSSLSLGDLYDVLITLSTLSTCLVMARHLESPAAVSAMLT